MRTGLVVVLMGLLVGLALEFHVLGWGSVPGNRCGGRYTPCPDGTTPTLLLAFLFTVVGGYGLVFALQKFTAVRPGKALPALLAAAGVLAALWPGWQAYLWMRGPVLRSVWQAEADRPSSVHGVGAWTVQDGKTVIRARTDALIAYDSGSGKREWLLDAPVRMSVCAMSDRVSDGVGLVAFARHEVACGSVRAVDARSGRVRWERELPGARQEGGGSLLTADGDVGVALSEGAVHGFGLADGKERWTIEPRPSGKRSDGIGYVPTAISAADGTTRVVVICEGSTGFDSAWLLTLDNATGRELGRSPLPVESSLTTYGILRPRTAHGRLMPHVR
ncbi:PQQ-like beta-propeller repeat protein [Streptomyces sp. MRC013]|uniref:outer membrane protein assembly factor BamB family protein n=1 Tax=Streptomyces sp. MRC013 TaxID=2898276 RepID=UPI0020269692|nr:PQQ-binding-like beta-propeller repeat protein [Streptomyces sp. MRC013]URM92530.1 PQQ-like beta-propeller repeat protein [Streptomyces sp. MRC013]